MRGLVELARGMICTVWQRETEADRQRVRETDRQTQSERQTDKQTDRE